VKIIKIFHGEQPIELYDDGKESLEECAKTFCNLMTSDNINILQTTSGILVMRPSKIDGFLISEKERNVNDSDEDFIRDEE
jgi:hypothetical protein